MDDKTRKKLSFIINVVFVALIAVLVYFGVKIAEPVLVPVIIAFLVAWALRKPINWLEKKTHIKKSIVALIVVILCYGIFGTLLAILVVRGFGLLQNFFSEIPDFYYDTIFPTLKELFTKMEQVFARFDLQLMDVFKKSEQEIYQTLTGIVTDLSYTAISWVSNKALSVPGMFLKTLITLIITVFVTMDYPEMMEFLKRQIPEKTNQFIVEIKNHAGGTLLRCLRSYLLIMLLTFSELLIGLSLLQVPNAMVIAVLIAIVDIMPVLGTGGVVIPWAIISFIMGNVPRGIGLLVLYVVILVVRNIVEPKIVGEQVGLHPVVTLASMFIGLNLFGLLGMFGFPIGLSVVKHLNDKGIIHIYK